MGGPSGLLDRALRYALDVVSMVTPEHLSRATTCRGWDLRTLLLHANESLTVLDQGIETGRIGLCAAPDDPVVDPVPTFHARARRIMAANAPGRPVRAVAVEGCPLSAVIMTSIGALELAVHGWDVSQASGQRRPIPPPLAAELLVISPLLITDDTRDSLFEPAVAVAPDASPSDRLVAFLGRG